MATVWGRAKIVVREAVKEVVEAVEEPAKGSVPIHAKIVVQGLALWIVATVAKELLQKCLIQFWSTKIVSGDNIDFHPINNDYMKII